MENIFKKLLFLSLLMLPGVLLAAPKGKIVAPEVTATPLGAIKEETKADAKPQATAEFKFLGYLGVAYAENTYVITCGGPKVGFSYGWFGISVGLFPSLVHSIIYRDSNVATPIRPNLGAGPEISLGKITLIAPIFYMPNNEYRYTFGIGYKF